MGCIMDFSKFKSRDNHDEAQIPTGHQHVGDAASAESGAELRSQALQIVSFC